MIKILLLVLLGAFWAPSAFAQCAPLPYTLTDGTVAEASQVMANFNAVNACAQSGTPVVATNPAMAALLTASVPQGGIIRLGFAAKGDAPAQVFLPENGTCASNSRVNDGGSCVNTTSGDGNSFYTVYAAGADAREWGVKADNGTDNTATFQLAFNWALSGSGCLVLPQGTIFYNTGPTGTIPSGVSVCIRGAGADLSALRSGANGMVLTKTSTDFSSSVHLRDFAMETAGVNVNTGISVQAAGNITNPSNTAQSDVTGVAFRGNDNYGEAKCWANGFTTNYVSNINFTNDYFLGCVGSPSTGNGINLTGGSSTSTIGTVYNVQGSSFNALGNGLVYGTFIQGVTVNQSNFTNDANGIFVPSGGTSMGQLGVSNSQFGLNAAGIQDQVGVPNTQIVGNTFFVPNASQTAIKAVSNIQTIGSNTFFGVTGAPSSQVGIELTGTVGFGGTITGNHFGGLATGLLVDSGASGGVIVSDNFFENVTTRISSAATIVTYQGASPLGFVAAVSGAVSGAGSLTQLTVNSTAGFVNGQVVMITGVGGINACGMSSSAVERVSIVDGTHFLVQQCTFSGTYTSGGVVAPIQN